MIIKLTSLESWQTNSSHLKIQWRGGRGEVKVAAQMVLRVVFLHEGVDGDCLGRTWLTNQQHSLKRKCVVLNPLAPDFLQDITQLQELIKKWLLQFNEEKCSILHQCHMGNTPIHYPSQMQRKT